MTLAKLVLFALLQFIGTLMVWWIPVEVGLQLTAYFITGFFPFPLWQFGITVGVMCLWAFFDLYSIFFNDTIVRTQRVIDYAKR